MKLISARVTNYRSILDSGEFRIDPVTCLVGKNEAGKTAILQALERLNPLNSGNKKYDKLIDYPRRNLTAYDTRHPDGDARVITTSWELEAADIEAVEEEFGAGSIKKGVLLKISKSYESDKTIWDMPFDEAKAVSNLIKESGLTTQDQTALGTPKTSASLLTALEAVEAPTDGHNNLKAQLDSYRDKKASLKAIDLLSPLWPKFLYSSSFDRMPGKVSVNQMKQPRQPNQAGRATENEERIFQAFLDMAGTTLDELDQAPKLEELTAKLEAASNTITETIFEYWTQNTSLEIEVKAQQGRPQDPPPFNTGTVVEARVKNTIHKMTVPFSERSAGFVWFFSFLALFSQVKKAHGKVIILLDEPGLNLHAKAQYDLLRYIKEKLEPHHQVIYTTHSPFMVPAENLSSVRTVEDVIVPKGGRVESLGTKVSEDVLSVQKDTLFPLQAALGYELSQTLFVGKNVLLVEGPSDILYLEAASAALRRRGRTGKDSRWVICPASGIDKVHTFVSLFSGSKLNISVLTDYAKGDKTKIENLKKSGILEASRIFQATDFCAQDEADLEDWFGDELICRIINGAYSLDPTIALTPVKMAAAEKTPRRIKQAETCFRIMPPAVAEFDHFAPSSWLIQHPETLDGAEPFVADALDRFEVFFKKLNAHI